MSHVYSLFLKGDISHEELYLMLTPAQVAKFVELHQQVKAAMEGEGELPPELVISMSQTFIRDHRKLMFALVKIDNVLEDLEREVASRAGSVNIVRREG